MTARLLLLLVHCALLLPAAGALQTASSVCVYNDAAFVLSWKLEDVETQELSSPSKSYPVWQSKCLDTTALKNVSIGASLRPVVSAVWGKTITVDAPVLYDPVNATAITYVCKGTTLDFGCVAGPPPPTAGNVTAEVGQFLLGFTEGLGTEVGFAPCIKDMAAVYRSIKAVVDFFESGFNTKSLPAIAKAFELIGEMLKSFVVAITECVKDAKAFAAKMKEVAAALSGNVWDILKVIVTDAVHIWHERTEITADCKAVTTDWHGRDFKGSGKAVGDIVGIIVNGL